MTTTVLHEAGAITSAQLTGKTWRIKVIEGDRKGSSAYYPKEVVEAGAPLFAKGTRIYSDHPSSDEKWSRPERSIKDIIGVFESDATYENGDLYANATFFSKHQEEIKELAEAGVIGMSIRASGDVEETADGPVLKAFTSVQSVDVVTTAGAGGGFDKLLESARNDPESTSSDNKEESVMDETLKAALDGLVEALKDNAEKQAALTERLDAKEEAERKAIEEANKPKELSALEVAEKLTEAGLTKSQRTRVLAVVEAGTELDEAITAEKEYAKSILEESKGETFGSVKDELNESDKFDFGSIFTS